MEYRTIVADPPWRITMGTKCSHREGSWGPYEQIKPLPYPTMTVAEISALPVSDLACDAAHLYLWTTNKYLEDAYAVARAWGFRPAQCLTWCKKPMGLGLGGAFVPTTEFVLFCRRGTLQAKGRIDSTWWQWRRGAHSAKPEAFIDMVERVSPGPYLEMFARRRRLGWDAWGNEVASDLVLPLGA